MTDFPHPECKKFIDFYENLQFKDIQNTVAVLSRYSAGEMVFYGGMGTSQGRHSALNTARLVAEATQHSVSETGVSTA